MPRESVILYPRAAFHLGERGIGLEETSLILHSDTLFSALCTVWRMLYGEDALTRELLPSDGETERWQPPFIISSAFPFAGSVRFYPKPFLPYPIEEGQETDEAHLSQRVKLKDVEFVSEAILISLLSGEHQLLPSDEELLHDGSLWISREEGKQLHQAFGVKPSASLVKEPFWEVKRVPRVVLDVQTGASNIWHFGRVAFRRLEDGKPEALAGYHFLVNYLDEQIAERFRAALRLLGDIGIGGDRSSGHGLFEPHFGAPLTFKEPPDSNAFITLSLTFPKPNELDHLLGDACRYRWLTRGGWIGGGLPTPFRRRTVRMLAEGSLLTSSSERVWGQAIEVTPQDASALGVAHRVYRFGFAFPLGVRS